MTDILIVAFVLVYAVLGYFSGLVRRVIGLVGLFAGFAVSTEMTPLTSNVWMQANPSWLVPDARMLVYFVILILLVIVVEGFAGAYHSKLQISFVLLDKASGAVVGALGALLAVTVVLYLLFAASVPSGGAPDGAQIQVSTAIKTNSALAPKLFNSVGGFAVILFRPVTPVDPSAFFNGQASKLQ